jgi:hypothetical protein
MTAGKIILAKATEGKETREVVYDPSVDITGAAGNCSTFSVLNLGDSHQDLGISCRRLHKPDEFVDVMPGERLYFSASTFGGVGIVTLRSISGTTAAFGVHGVANI